MRRLLFKNLCVWDEETKCARDYNVTLSAKKSERYEKGGGEGGQRQHTPVYEFGVKKTKNK